MARDRDATLKVHSSVNLATDHGEERVLGMLAILAAIIALDYD